MNSECSLFDSQLAALFFSFVIWFGSDSILDGNNVTCSLPRSCLGIVLCWYVVLRKGFAYISDDSCHSIYVVDKCYKKLLVHFSFNYLYSCCYFVSAHNFFRYAYDIPLVLIIPMSTERTNYTWSLIWNITCKQQQFSSCSPNDNHNNRQ